MDRKPSEIIQDFIDLMEQSHTEFRTSQSIADGISGRTYTYTHELEDCEDERLSEFAGKWRDELQERRRQRDNMDLWRAVHEFGKSEQNKPTLKRLKGLLAKQIDTEKFLETDPKDREYKGGRE